jgi:hypothetical protein
MRMKSTRFAGLCLAPALVLVIPLVGQAGLLSIPFDPNGPTITNSAGALTLNAAAGGLSISGVPVSLDGASLPVSGAFSGMSAQSINLVVDASGDFVSGAAGYNLTGNLDLNGDGQPDASGNLLSGNIFRFGAQTSGPTPYSVDGLFHVTGGALTQAIPLTGGGTMSSLFSMGEEVGFLATFLQFTQGSPGDFSQDATAGDGFETTTPTTVPAPGSLTLAFLGVTILSLYGFLENRRRDLGSAPERPQAT